MGDDGVDDVGDDVLSCPGRYYCFSPTLLPTRRELKLNCSRSHQSSVLERSYSDMTSLDRSVGVLQHVRLELLISESALSQHALLVHHAALSWHF